MMTDTVCSDFRDHTPFKTDFALNFIDYEFTFNTDA